MFQFLSLPRAYVPMDLPVRGEALDTASRCTVVSRSHSGWLLLAYLCLVPQFAFGYQQARAPTLPSQYFVAVGELTLDENPSVINVSPKVSVESNGQFLIADPREAQVRVYSAAGRLLRHFGRRGQGPGEFQRPIAASRLPSGEVFVADFSRRLVIFDSTGERSILTASVPLLPIYAAIPLSSQRVLLAGQQSSTSARTRIPLIHVWNRHTQEIERSFFPTPGDSVVQLAARNFGAAYMAMRGDTIAAVSALSDTVYLFNVNGQPLGTVPLHIHEYLRVRSYTPQETSDPIRRARWLNNLHFLAGIHWLPDGSFLVQYERPRDAESEWNLVRVSRTGVRMMELRNTPELLAIHHGVALFIHPSADLPNRWLLAKLTTSTP